MRGAASESIDPVSFTTLRLAAGAAMLGLLLAFQPRRPAGAADGDWPAALALYAYAILFSLAYLALSAGTGALLLFGAVQLTMFAAGVARGERLDPLQGLGLVLAVAGVCWLLWPGVAAPPLASALAMLGAGVAWGLYSLRGRASSAPLAETAGNFRRAAPVALGVSLIALWTLPSGPRLEAAGAGYALLSGALASGLGYAVWYAALPGLTALRAATVQLAVPALALLGGVLVLDEPLTLGLLLAAAVVLGGISLVIVRRPA